LADALLYELFYGEALSNPKNWNNKGYNDRSSGLFNFLNKNSDNLNGITALEFKRFIDSMDKNRDSKVSQQEALTYI